MDPKIDVDNIDYGKRTLHLVWHPLRNAMAVAGLNNLYIYSTQFITFQVKTQKLNVNESCIKGHEEKEEGGN